MKILHTVLILIALMSHDAFALKPQKFNRDIAIFWDSSEIDQRPVSSSFPHTKLEVILNHFGFRAHYFNVDNLNEIEHFDHRPYYALITWFSDDETKNIETLQDQISKWLKTKKKLVVLGEFGFFDRPERDKFNITKINEILKLANLEYQNHQYKSSIGLRPVYHSEKSLVEFERSLNNEIPNIKIFKTLNNSFTRLLSINSTIRHLESPVVLYNEQIFYVAKDFTIFYNPQLGHTQWKINPFNIIKWLLPDKLMPIPDTTTLNGKRILYTHIDGDAYINISNIDRKTTSGKIISEKILEQYKLPVGLSYITAEIDPQLLGKKTYLDEIKEITNKDYVELASHTYYHPLSWQTSPDKFEINAYLDRPQLYKGGPIMAYMPKDKLLDYKREIVESISRINKLIDLKKETNTIYWSGSCEPPIEALKLAYENEILNMNGGDSRFDDDYPSYSHLYPLYRKVGPYYQIYSSNSNEIPYTNNWTGPFSGQSKLIQTFENTETPVRIKPMNIYYHFYSGEREAAINALKKVYNYVVSQEMIAIYPSKFIRIVNNWINVEIERIEKHQYHLKNLEHLKTFRIDSDKYIPDYKKSRNIIGHRQHNGSVYISIGTDKTAILSLTTHKPKKIFIQSSDFLFDKLAIDKNKIKVRGITNYAKEMKIYIPNNHRIAEDSDFENISYSNNIAKIQFKNTYIDKEIKIEKSN